MKTGHALGLLCLGLAMLAGAEESAQAQLGGERKRLLLCSTTQVGDFARMVVGDRCLVRTVLAPGTDPHLYELRPGDAQLASQADLCLENGLHLEGKDWMKTLAANAGKPLVTCTRGVEPLHLPSEANQPPVHDPHAWFAPKNAAIYIKNITQAVVELDPPHAQEYKRRASLALDQLRTLHLWIEKQVNDLPKDRRVLITSHDAFQYYCQAYGFTSRAPVGWSTGDEIGGGITPERRRQVVDSIRSAGVKAIFVETSVNPKLIREIAEEAGVRIGGTLYSDSMGDIGSAGETYLGMMRENTLIILSALE